VFVSRLAQLAHICFLCPTVKPVPACHKLVLQFVKCLLLPLGESNQLLVVSPISLRLSHLLQKGRVLTQGDWKQLICLQHLITSYFISGDAGYPCSRWLITPIHRPHSRAECAFNEAHVRARSVIERTFGVLKSRFRCLDKSGGSLMYSPTKVPNIVAACAVLHNLANRHGLPGDVADDLEDHIHPQDPVRGE
uniref:DDE Tnp4 domain-containing protein n=1 Tax=Xenopus tropicalis TaxID=8364 RepID=A0A803JVB5_XENTR